VPASEGGERVKPRHLSDDALADALVVRAAGAAPATPCPSETRIWEAFQGRLAPAEVASLLDHAASCADCSLAMRVAQAMGSEAMPARAAGRESIGARVWGALAGTVLRPAPALAYLLLLALSLPLYRETMRRNEPPPPVVAPPVVTAPAARSLTLSAPSVIRITGDVEMRGGSAPATLRLPVAPGEVVLLKVFPDFADAPDAARGPLVVRLLAGDAVVYETLRPAGGLDSDGSLPIVLDGRDLRSGASYRIEVRPEHGEPVFRQTFTLASE
jgi:hypothetical protein